MRFQDFTGKQFGEWFVIERAENSRKMTRYFCRCSCGSKSIVQAVHLRNGVSTRCRDCYESRNGMSDLESVAKLKFSMYRNNAKAKGRVFELTLDTFRALVCSSCFYCGDLPSKPRIGYRGVRRTKSAPVHGVDRKDNDAGYVLDNCVPCCSGCNYMKKNHSISDFIDRCSRIAERHGKEKRN